jgi:hypothetical protein
MQLKSLVHITSHHRCLLKVVTERWSKVDDETRTFLQTIYDRELAKYRIEMKEYVEMYGEDALESQKMVYKSRKADATRDSKGADSSKKPKATCLSPKDQLMRALQHHSRTSTVSDISNHTAQGSTTGASSTSSNYSQWNQLFNSHVASWQMINPLASTTSDTIGPLSQGNSTSSSDSHWNRLLNSHAASWQMNPYNLPLHGNVLSSTGPHFDQLQNSMNNDPNRSNTGCNGYLPFNQPASATFQMGNNPDSSSGNSIGFNDMVIPFGSVEAAGISGAATRSTSDESMSNLPSSGLANPYTYAQMPPNHSSLDNQILVPIMQMPTQQSQSQSHASFFAQPDCRTSDDHSIINKPLTLPTCQFENPTATAYSMQHIQNQASFQLEQSSFGNPVHSLTNELCEDRQVPTKPDACTKLESGDHTNDSSSSESNVSFELLGDNASNVMLGEDLKNTFDSDSS